MSTELPVATRHHRDMTEKLLKATLDPNTHTLRPGCLKIKEHYGILLLQGDVAPLMAALVGVNFPMNSVVNTTYFPLKLHLKHFKNVNEPSHKIKSS